MRADNHTLFLSKGFCLLLVLFAGAGCNRYYQPGALEYNQIRINDQVKKDTAIERLLQPYAVQVNQLMSVVIGEVAVPLEKKLPESNLGNLMADAMKAEAGKIFGFEVDAAFMNYGGIRISQLPAGKLTLSKVFELMPFDNLMVVQRLPGTIVQEFLDSVAYRGGWPGAGVEYVIRNRRATQVMIGGLPLDNGKLYVIANSDYVANGGDNCTMLVNFPQENKGILVRDALIDYFSAITAKGEKISARLENRVKYVD